MSDGFLGRWSRRKQEARALDAPAPDSPAHAGPAPQPPTPVQLQAPARPAEAPAAPSPAPTLAEAQALTPADDFSRFVSRTVAPQVRNAAMKQLFRDPRFNVMDGLDTYIDDYSVTDPMPLATLRKLASARFLGLVQEEAQPETGADASAPESPCSEPLPTNPNPAPSDVAQLQGSPPGCTGAADRSAPLPATASQTPYAHTHLRLQPDHAPPDAGSGGGDR